MNQDRFFYILPLFLVMFIDTLGTAFIIPLLGPIFIDPSTSIISTTPHIRNILYGLTLGVYSIFAFFAAPILGDLSDRIGRKKILLMCLLGVLLGYLIFALGVVMKSVSLLIAGRIVGGFTSGSLSTAQAAVIDISTPENKATNIGYILFAISLGFMVGPVLAGTLSNSNLVSWFDITTPLYFAAALSLINIIFLQLVFKETFLSKERKPIKLLSGLTVFISAFTVPALRRLTFAFLFLQLGWSTFVQFVSLFLTLQYHFSANQVGIFMGCVGAGFTLAYCYLLNIVTKLFSLKRIALTSVGLMSLMMLAIVTINNELSAWIISVPAATGLALSFTVLTTMFSNSVSADKQGWIMGLTGAIGAFSFGITGLGAGFIANLGASAPIWVAYILLTVSALIISTLTNISKR